MGADDKGRANLVEDNRIRYQAMLESIFKFRLFWAGLLFTVMAFTLQFPVKSGAVPVKALQIGAWLLLGGAAVFAVKDCGGLSPKLTEKVVEGLDESQRRWMRGLFIVGSAALIAAKILDFLGM